jgi:hypothetical protein
MSATTKNSNKNPDETFFVDARSRRLDDVLAGKITFDQYFIDVDNDAKARAYASEQVRQHSKLKRLVGFATFFSLICLLPLVYITIGVASFLESDDSAIQWLSIATAIATVAGTYRFRNIFRQVDR